MAAFWPAFTLGTYALGELQSNNAVKEQMRAERLNSRISFNENKYRQERENNNLLRDIRDNRQFELRNIEKQKRMDALEQSKYNLNSSKTSLNMFKQANLSTNKEIQYEPDEQGLTDSTFLRL